MLLYAIGDAQDAPLAICQIDLKTDRACFVKMVVHPDYRNIGVAKAVLKLIREAIEPICDRVYTVTARDNLAGQQLIKTANFKETSVTDKNGHPVYALELSP